MLFCFFYSRFLSSVFFTTIGRIGAESFDTNAVCSYNGMDYLANIPGANNVKKIAKRAEIVIYIVAACSVVNGNTTNTALSKKAFIYTTWGCFCKLVFKRYILTERTDMLLQR